MAKRNSYEFDRFRDQSSEARLLDLRAAVGIETVVPTLTACGLKPEMRVLDVGSGTGRRTLEIANFVSRGEIVGIDNSEDLLSAARRSIGSARHSNLLFHKVDVSSSRSLCALGRFDFIYMRLVVQHLAQPIQTLRTLKSLLTKGGRIFIEDSDRDWMDLVPAPRAWRHTYSKMKAGQERNGGDPRSGCKLGHYLTSAGFTDVEVKLVPVCGGSSTVLNWVRNYAPSYLNFLSKGEAVRAKRVLDSIERSAKKREMFFYQVWFQVSGKR